MILGKVYLIVEMHCIRLISYIYVYLSNRYDKLIYTYIYRYLITYMYVRIDICWVVWVCSGWFFRCITSRSEPIKYCA